MAIAKRKFASHATSVGEKHQSAQKSTRMLDIIINSRSVLKLLIFAQPPYKLPSVSNY